MFSLQTLLSKIQGSSTIDFGDLFNESVSLFKKVWVQGLILQLISGLIMLPVLIGFYIPYFFDKILSNKLIFFVLDIRQNSIFFFYLIQKIYCIQRNLELSFYLFCFSFLLLCFFQF